MNLTPEEREMVRELADKMGIPGSEIVRFCGQVDDRLSEAAEEYGELGYLDRSFTECEEEAIEEQHDAGGWTALALRLLERDIARGFPSGEAELIRLRALQGIVFAVQSERAFRGALDVYREYQEEIGSTDPPEPPIGCHDNRVDLTN